MEYKFVVSVRRQYKNRGDGLKISILKTILENSDGENYNSDSICDLVKQIDKEIQYKELKEFTICYKETYYSFKVDSLDMLIWNRDNVCPKEYSDSFVSDGMDRFRKRMSSIEQFDKWCEENPLV